MDTNESPLPIFPERALSSKAVFYRPMEDIDIYVEDEGSETFYTELLKRLVDNNVRIATVIPLRGRSNVIKYATEYSDSRPALFLIDGDLYWVTSLPLPSAPTLYIHPCYSVENYLFCEKAMIQIIIENSGTLTESDAKRQLNWSTIRKQLQINLVPLFIEFAIAFFLCPNIKTVSRGIGCILRDSSKGSKPQIDMSRINAIKRDVQTEVLKQVSAADYQRTKTTIEARIHGLDDQLDIVSGKDFLLPIQIFEANWAGGQKVQKKSFLFRLARHCDLKKLHGLRDMIFRSITPESL